MILRPSGPIKSGELTYPTFTQRKVSCTFPSVSYTHLDNIIANCVPASANDELSKQGIDLRQLNISQIIDTFEDLDEDIVNVDLDQDETCMKVRVYVQ